jgi:eukaryotic-like serine/threonine-protein kinase
MSDPNDQRTREGRRGQPADGGAHQVLFGEDLAAGAAVGNYLVEELRSRGGFATIYRARHQTLGRLAALKVLHKILVGDKSMLSRFEQEARAVNLIRHPNIVDVYEVGELPDGRPYFIMEWLEGMDLDLRLREQGPFVVAETLSIMEDLCAALAAAHDVGVVHRDLKASNIVLLPAAGWFDVKLVDFGIAKLVDPRAIKASDISSTGTRLGTPWNMAPEQFLGLNVDARADIYALGIVLYQMLTGRLPFRGNTPAELEELHLYAHPPYVTDLVPTAAGVDPVIQKCLQKEREQRYASVQEVLHDLRRAATSPVSRAPAMLVPAVGLRVEMAVDSASQAVLKALDEAMRVAKRTCQHYDLISDQPNALFVVQHLPDEESAGCEARSRMVEAALDLLDQLSRFIETGVHASLVVHASPVIARIGLDGNQYVAGELLCIGDWAVGQARNAVTVTRAALAQLEPRFLTQVVPGRPDARRVLMSNLSAK